MMHLIPFSKRSELFSVPAGAWVDRFFDDFGPLFRADGGEWRPSFDVSETDEQSMSRPTCPGLM